MCSFLLVLLPLHSVLPSTHWVVTENGKIQAQVFIVVIALSSFIAILNPTKTKQCPQNDMIFITIKIVDPTITCFVLQPDSIYFLRQPHDFVAFIHQVSQNGARGFTKI